ncbi:peptidoglycan DD-metalloendopeptidase family protein [Streptomyces fuscigenes]|uniref:peptidoglycan DD-metalloendopeptidase family protein n=1 Tax=Streptomyces fuscigenes TaxID=1528880 RepID=UPI001F4589DE|nr:M23 family metallopeptidase [Streptomyces fuscigenes]MCF3961121.1 peptidoglycan DD-metalloendopeptidase family protein [Streptomyces fuscigenes]
MNDLPTQADYTAYETDPLFGALPGGHDAQQYGNGHHQYGQGQYADQQYADQQYAEQQYSGRQYGDERYGEQQHRDPAYTEQQYGDQSRTDQQYAYGDGATGQWDGGPGAAPAAPPAGQGPTVQQYGGWEQSPEHGYAYAAQAAPSPTLAQGFPVADAYGYHQQEQAAATAGYAPTMQWTVPADGYTDPQAQQHGHGGHPAQPQPPFGPAEQHYPQPGGQLPHGYGAHDQQTQVELRIPPDAHVAHHPDAHPGQEHGGAAGGPPHESSSDPGTGLGTAAGSVPAPAPAPYDAGWYASQETLVAPLVVPADAAEGFRTPPPPPAPGAPADGTDSPGPEPADGARAHDDHAPEAGEQPVTPEALDAVDAVDAVEPAGTADASGAVVTRPGRAADRANARGAASRSRRRAPAKRSALLTIAVPSACVMGVAGIAAASVSAVGGSDDKQDDTATTAAADPASVEPVAANDKMDTQLAALSADARDFGDRASRTQERLDLKARQAAQKKKREEEAARKEAARPKYLLPVKRRGLSAYFGQAGVNWMSVHTGIDFPVMTGTPVMAVTDGTVRTQWNSSYGNMAIVTAADGTETWYCHLSSTRVRSGSVKAGDVIAYSGNTGNTTGPHLHFEVRPGGGAAIDPLPWLRGHGLDPT